MDLQIGDNETADLFTVDYKRVAIVVLPRGERPRYVLHDGRVFSYYAHTTVHGQKEICHPFREVTGLYVSTRPMVSA